MCRVHEALSAVGPCYTSKLVHLDIFLLSKPLLCAFDEATQETLTLLMVSFEYI